MKLLVLMTSLLFVVGCNAQVGPWWWWPGSLPWISALSPRHRGWDQRPSRNRYPWYPQGEDEYAASLGGAPVGFYRKQNNNGYGRRSETTGISLGGARVGLYGKERHDDGYNWDY